MNDNTLNASGNNNINEEESMTAGAVDTPADTAVPAGDTEENRKADPDAAPADGAPADEPADEPQKKKESLLSIVFDYLEILVYSIAAVLLVFTLGFRLCMVDGSSMRNTLYNSQMLVTTSLVDPKPGDIIVFHMTSDTYDHFNEALVKRLIAVGGQTVRYDYTDKSLYVDGVKIDDSWAWYLDDAGRQIDRLYQLPNHSYNPITQQFEVTVPEGTLFVMGDNRNHSSDSRAVQVGFVDERRVLGKVIGNLGESRGCLGGR